MSDSILNALKEINEAYEKVKQILKGIICSHKYDSIIINNEEFLKEIGVIE